MVHLAVKSEVGIRHIDVWETEADWQRFHAERLNAVVAETLAEFGIPASVLPEREDLKVVGVWVPQA